MSREIRLAAITTLRMRLRPVFLRRAKSMKHSSRIAFFPLLPRNNAATRAFCERMAPYFERIGIETRLFPPSSPHTYRVLGRSKGRFRVPLAALYWYAFVAPRRLMQIAAALRSDVIFIQRGLLRHRSAPILEGLVRFFGGIVFGRVILYHCDDALYTVVPRPYLAARFRWADWVLTGNEEIAEAARRSNPNIFFVEGAVDVQSYPLKSHCDRQSVTIGWIGTAAPAVLMPFTDALVEVCARTGAIVKIVSDRPFAPAQLEGKVVNEEWTEEREFETFGDFDIGIMPLADTAYNRGKEAFKLKEYMAAGLPVVCSPVGHNVKVLTHGKQGFFAVSRDDWVETLIRLCGSVRLRSELGRAGRALIEERYSLDDHADRFVSFVRAIAWRGSDFSHGGASTEVSE